MNETVRFKGRKVYHRVTTSWGHDGKTRQAACGVWGNRWVLRDYSPDSNEGLKPCRKCFPEGVSDEQSS